MMCSPGEQQCLVRFVDEPFDPLHGKLAVDLGEWSLAAPHRNQGGVVGVGRIDRRRGRLVARAQVAHSDSPISATNGPVSS
jgi:hypothetical protein